MTKCRPSPGDVSGDEWSGVLLFSHLLAVHAMAANEQERALVHELAQQAQHVGSQTVKLAFADHGHPGEEPAKAVCDEGIGLQAIKLPELKKGDVLLPRQWVVECKLCWLDRFRRHARP